MKKTKINSNILRKFSLKEKILNEDCSIEEAATAFDMLPCEANEILFSQKPEKRNICFAVKLYKKGYSIKNSSVASGVAPKTLIKILKIIYSK